MAVLSTEWPQDKAHFQRDCEDGCVLNCCVPPNLHVETLAPKDDGTRRRGLWEAIKHEGGALRSGISDPIKEDPQSSPAPSTVQGRSEKMLAVIQENLGISPGWRLNVDFQAPLLFLLLTGPQPVVL